MFVWESWILNIIYFFYNSGSFFSSSNPGWKQSLNYTTHTNLFHYHWLLWTISSGYKYISEGAKKKMETKVKGDVWGWGATWVLLCCKGTDSTHCQELGTLVGQIWRHLFNPYVKKRHSWRLHHRETHRCWKRAHPQEGFS